MFLQDEVRATEALPPPREENRRILTEVLGAFVSSRALIWIAGVTTAVLVSLEPNHLAVEPIARFLRPFGSHLLNVLVSPGARYDSAWFLSVAKFGYAHSVQAVFFPLYPAAIALLGLTGLPNLLAGILLTSAFALGALFLLYRLVELDLGSSLAREVVWIVAWLPMALFLSAVYS